MRESFRALLALAGLGLLLQGCGDSGDDSEGSGGSGAVDAAGNSGTGGGGGAGASGRGAGGASSGAGGKSGGAGGDGGTAAGQAGTSTAGGDAGGTAGSGGDAGESSSGGAGGPPDPGECGRVATFEDGRTPSREVFVDAEATGSGDGSADNPYATLDAALSDVTPGTAIRIRPGTYDGGVFASDLAGSADAPIWIGGVPGSARPVISGGDNAFQLSPASFVIVHDLEVSGQSANGINVDDGEVASGRTHDLVFRNLFIHDIGDGGNQDCLKLSGVDAFFVLDSEFQGCSGGSAIDHVGCHQGLVAHNDFVDLGGNGVQSKGGSSDIEITRNRFFNAGERAVNMGGSTGFEFFRPALSPSGVNYEARDIRVTANVFRGGVSPIAFVGCVACLAANNTIVDPERWVVRILQETTSTDEYAFSPASDGRFLNNIVYYELADLSTHVNVGADTAPETFEFSNDLWYASDAPEDSEPSSLPVTESAGIYGEDPGFADAPSDDYAIGSDSPAAEAGVAVDGISGDVNGACYGTPPSIGAYQAD